MKKTIFLGLIAILVTVSSSRTHAQAAASKDSLIAELVKSNRALQEQIGKLKQAHLLNLQTEELLLLTVIDLLKQSHFQSSKKRKAQMEKLQQADSFHETSQKLYIDAIIEIRKESLRFPRLAVPK